MNAATAIPTQSATRARVLLWPGCMSVQMIPSIVLVTGLPFAKVVRAAIDRQRQKVGLPTARLIAESVKNGIARRRARLEAIDELGVFTRLAAT